MAEQLGGDRGDRRRDSGAELRQHDRGAGAQRAGAGAGLRGVPMPRRRPHQRRHCWRSSARCRRGSPRTATASSCNQASVRPHRGAVGSPRRARPIARAGARAGALRAHLPPRRRRPRCRGQGAASPRSASGWRRSAPHSARTCSPTSRPTRWCSRREDDLAGLSAGQITRGARGGAGARPCRQARDHARRARASSRSCSPRPGATCARRPSGPGSPAATAAARPTTRRSSPRRCGCAPSAPACSAIPIFAHYRLDDAMAKTPEAVRGAARAGVAPARGARAGRPRRPAGAGAGRGRQLRARRLGLALLRRKAAQGALRHRRGRDRALSSARQHDRGGLRHRAAGCSACRSTSAHDVPVWHPGRAGLGGARRRRRRHRRPVLRRLFCPALEAQRRLDDDPARPGEARTATSGRWSST